MVTWLMDGLVSWLANLVVDLLALLLTFLAGNIFVSPDVTVLPQVTTIAGTAALAVNAGYGLAIITAGILIMVGGTVETRYRVKELLPRLVVGFVLSSFAIPLCRAFIEVANALTVAMVGASASTERAVKMTQTHVRAASTDAGAGVLAVTIGLLIVVLMFTLYAGWIVRVALLVILAGIAPIALACYALPATQPAAALWWRTLLGCLGTAVLQAVAFATGIGLLTEPDANLPVLLGLPGSDVLNLFLVMVLLWLTVKIPGLIRRYVTRGGGGTTVRGLVSRAVFVQSVTRRLPVGRIR
jgi:hypothetical protein